MAQRRASDRITNSIKGFLQILSNINQVIIIAQVLLTTRHYRNLIMCHNSYTLMSTIYALFAINIGPSSHHVKLSST